MSEEEIIEEVYQKLSSENIALSWKNLEHPDLEILHHAVGDSLREHYKLGGDKEKSFRIVEKVWEKFKND